LGEGSKWKPVLGRGEKRICGRFKGNLSQKKGQKRSCKTKGKYVNKEQAGGGLTPKTGTTKTE